MPGVVRGILRLADLVGIVAAEEPDLRRADDGLVHDVQRDVGVVRADVETLPHEIEVAVVAVVEEDRRILRRSLWHDELRIRHRVVHRDHPAQRGSRGQAQPRHDPPRLARYRPDLSVHDMLPPTFFCITFPSLMTIYTIQKHHSKRKMTPSKNGCVASVILT